MTSDQFNIALGGFCRRRPFKPFLLEFTSGNRLIVSHPELVDAKVGGLFFMRRPDRGNEVFTAESVIRFLDPPTTPTP